jgi:hypothetical protein
MDSLRLIQLRAQLRRLLKRNPDKEDDRYAKVRVPLKKGPGGLHAAVALKEPPEY